MARRGAQNTRDRRAARDSEKNRSSPRPKVAGPLVLDESPVAAAPEAPAFPIVGIGASAGGIEAVTQLLSHLPPDPGLAFVVVQHLAPTHPSLLVQVLAKATAMAVSEAVHGTIVVPNHVYVIPPNTDLTLRGDALEVLMRPGEARRPHLPIDVFFRSLAEARKTTAIGVVLSGTATDGTEGLAAIKAEGGITFAQDPASAKYPMMPQSAIAAGAVDRVLSAEDLAAELVRLARHPYVRPEPPGQAEQGPPKVEAVIRDICKLLKLHTGIDLAITSSTRFVAGSPAG